MFFGIRTFGWQNYKREARGIIFLALPMLVAQIAQVGVAFIDTVMAGHLGESDLAAVAIGANIFMTVYVTLSGVVISLNPILSQLFGANKTQELVKTADQGFWFCLGLGIIGSAVLLLLTIPLQTHLQMSDYTRQMVTVFLYGGALALPGAMIHKSLHVYVASLNKSTPIMVVSLCALLLVIPSNYILMHGLFGLPKLGGAGCGFGTAIAYWFNYFALRFYISRSAYFKPFKRIGRLAKPSWKFMKEFLRLGIPIGLSYFLEVSLFSFIALLIASFGELYVATQQIVINVSSIVYMIPQTLGAALSVKVGQTIGQGSYARARHVAGVGISVGVFLAVCTALLILLFRTQIISVYTSDVQIIAVGTALLIYLAVFQVTDSIQTTVSGALRGYKLTRVAMIIHAISFWVFGLGCGYYLAFVKKMGIFGFWIALVISLSVAAVLLIGYLWNRSKAFLVRDKFYANLK